MYPKLIPLFCCYFCKYSIGVSLSQSGIPEISLFHISKCVIQILLLHDNENLLHLILILDPKEKGSPVVATTASTSTLPWTITKMPSIPPRAKGMVNKSLN